MDSENQEQTQELPTIHDIVGALGGTIGTDAQRVIGSIISTKRSLSKLGKSEKNPFHRYNFVPIDAYYENVASVAAENGLTWRATMSKVEIMNEITDERGKSTVLLRFDVSFDLFHECGAVWQDFSTITILHPAQGAQTAGSVLSYADKLFQRTTFSVVTGEKDADAEDSSFTPRKAQAVAKAPAVRFNTTKAEPPKVYDHPRLDEAPQGVQEAEAIRGAGEYQPNTAIVASVDETTNPATPVIRSVDELNDSILDNKLNLDAIFETMAPFLPLCKDLASLGAFWKNNTHAIKLVQERGTPEQYTKITQAFAARKAELKGT